MDLEDKAAAAEPGDKEATHEEVTGDTAAGAEAASGMGHGMELEQEEKAEEREPEPEAEEPEEEQEEEIFADPRMKIYEILDSLTTSGSTSCNGWCQSYGRNDLTLPGLVVDGVGPVALPLHASQVGPLAARCVPEPFGGESGVGDTTVRKTWQLGPDHFEITNPNWQAQVANVAHTACGKPGLDLASVTVAPQLSKLVLYGNPCPLADMRRR